MFNLLYSYGSNVEDVLILSLGLIILIVIVSLIVEIAIIVACVKIANKNNRSGAVWGWLGFFFGLIALIILLCLPKINLQTHYTNSTTATSKYSWTCKHCGHLNFGQYTNCGVCGNPKNKLVQYAKKSSEKWTCPKCGEINNANAMHCINCFEKKSN